MKFLLILLLHLHGSLVPFTDRRFQIPHFGQAYELRETILPPEVQCYDEPSTENSFPELSISEEKRLLESSRGNVFFLETFCPGEDGKTTLSCRQACAVESTARTNPQMSINLFFLSSASPSNHTSQIIEHLRNYSNVQVNRIKVNEFIHGSPIEDWYLSGVLANSSWANIHMSDFLRFVTLRKYGGIYLDLDYVVTTSLENLTNFVGFEDEPSATIGSAVIGFSATGLGLTVANDCLQDLMRTYQGDIWADSSVGVLTRVIQKLCSTNDITKMMTMEECHGFQVFPSSALYPIHYTVWRSFFETENSEETMRLLDESKMVHAWNALSKDEIVYVGSKVPYALIAENYCPLVYNNCGDMF